MDIFRAGGFRRRLWLWGALFGALGAILLLGDWPVPLFLQQSVLAGVSARLKQPYTAGEMRWVPVRGVVFRDVAMQAEWPSARAKEAWVLGWLPLRPKNFLLVDVAMNGGRDDTGTLRLPWPQGETGQSLSEKIEIRGGEFYWHDARLGWSGVFRELAATIEPARHKGELTALLGETEPVSIAAAWNAGAGRISAAAVPWRMLPWIPALLRPAGPPVALTLDWRTRGDSCQFVFVQHTDVAPDIRLELDTRHDSLAANTSFTGKFSTDAVALALQGVAGSGTFDLALSPADTAQAGAWGWVVARERARHWTVQFALRAAALSGSVLDPVLAGMRVRGPVDLDVAGAYPAATTRVSLASRRGRLEGVRGFANFARRTGLTRFHAPEYTLLRLRATVGPVRTVVHEALFEGGGLGLAFSGIVSAKRIDGRLRALFSDDIVRASPELSRYRPFLDRQNGRVMVIFNVAGAPDSPRYNPVLPSAPVMLYRGVRGLFSGGVAVGQTAIRQGLSTIFD